MSGWFDRAGGQPANSIATYSLSSGAWSSLGAGLTVGPPGGNDYVISTGVFPNGDIIAGGNFAFAGGQPATRLAVYSFPATADFNHDGDSGTDADIEAFFACLSGSCCPTCPGNADFNNDGDTGANADIEAFFRVLAGGNC